MGPCRGAGNASRIIDRLPSIDPRSKALVLYEYEWPLAVEPRRPFTEAGMTAFGALQPMADDAAYG